MKQKIRLIVALLVVVAAFQWGYTIAEGEKQNCEGLIGNKVRVFYFSMPERVETVEGTLCEIGEDYLLIKHISGTGAMMLPHHNVIKVSG